MNYSYERVSTTHQDERRQEISLEPYKIDKRFIDKKSGKNANREYLTKLLTTVKSGDHVYCESISRLGRNVDDLRSLVEYFVKESVTVHFVKEGIATNGTGYKFLITILGAVAEMEREVIVDRVCEGIQKAKKFGTKSGIAIGRPPVQLPKEFAKYYEQWKQDQITATEFSLLMKASRSTLYRWIKQYKINS